MDSAELLDDDFDAFNDETFGDDGAEFSWPDDAGNDVFSDTFQANGNGPAINNKTSFVDDNDYGIENEMEESISRLVMDDEVDPGADLKAQRLANSHAYFMPPQVVNKNLNWFMEKDLPGGSSLLGSSVWSMHPTASAPPPPVLRTRPDENPVFGEAPRIAPPDKVDYMQTQRNEHHEQQLGHKLPDLDRQQVGEENKNWQRNSGRRAESEDLDASLKSHFAGILNANSAVGPSPPRPRVMTVQELEAMDVAKDTLGQALGQKKDSYGSPVKPTSISFQQPIRPTVAEDRSKNEVYNRPPPGLIPNQNTRPTNQYQFNQTRFTHPVYPPPNVMYGQHQGVRLPVHNMNHRPGYFNNGSHHSMQRHNLPRQGYIPSRNMVEPPKANIDPFAGLMTNQNKQRLKNIQIIQLQNDHPYRTDYYYQMREYRDTQDINCLKKLFPRKEETQTKNQYEPTKFENALGKLQAVSALAPKRIFDTKVGTKSSIYDFTYPSIRPRLLWEIEQLYSMFLDLKEVEFRIKADTIGTYKDRQSGEALYTKLYDVINKNDERMVDWLRVPKARALLFDVVVFLRRTDVHQDDSFELFCKILRAMPTSIMHKLENTNEDWKLFQKVEEMIQTCTTKQVDILLAEIPDYLFESRLGSSIYFSVLHAAALACRQDERTEFYVCKHAWQKENPGTPQEGYIPPNHLVGFQRIPKLIQQLMESERHNVSSILTGRGRIYITVLLELMIMSSVKGARSRMHEIDQAMKQRRLRDPKNCWMGVFYPGKAAESDPILDFLGPHKARVGSRP